MERVLFFEEFGFDDFEAYGVFLEGVDGKADDDDGKNYDFGKADQEFWGGKGAKYAS